MTDNLGYDKKTVSKRTEPAVQNEPMHVNL